MATVRMSLAEIAKVGPVDVAKVDALTEAAIAQFNVEDGFDPDDTMRGLQRVLAPSEVRAATGMTQAAFATAIGIPLKTWRNWEQGRTRIEPAGLALLRLIAADPKGALGVLSATLNVVRVMQK